MNVLQSILLGIVQGLTEFLPVSSSGHLIILENVMGIESESSLFFHLILHVGTLAAIFWGFQKDFRRLGMEILRMIYHGFCNLKILIKNKKEGSNEAYVRVIHNNYCKFAALLMITMIPTVMLGFVSRYIVLAAGNNMMACGVGFLFTGILLFVLSYSKSGKKIPRDTTFDLAMWIGICQGLSVFPGVSSLGVTIAVGILMGFNRKYAVKYGVFASVPVIAGAFLAELTHVRELHMTLALTGTYLAGSFAAAFTGILVIRYMISVTEKKKFLHFAVYSLVIGVVSIIGSFILA